jgi:hypothetical protein
LHRDFLVVLLSSISKKLDEPLDFVRGTLGEISSLPEMSSTTKFITLSCRDPY